MSFPKYPKIKIIGDSENTVLFENKDKIIYAEEKIDGANARFMFRESQLLFGSRNNDITSAEPGKSWTAWTSYVANIVQATPEVFAENESYVYFGEAMVKHSLAYNFKDHPPFILYDIWDMKTEKYVSRKVLENVCKRTGLVPVRLVFAGSVQQFDMKKPQEYLTKSAYGDVEMEGIVVKSADVPVRAKFVSDKFKEVNKDVFGLSKRQARATNDDSEYFISTYFTNARIDKCIFKLRDDGHPISMKMMGTLIKAVYDDCIEECWKEILNERRVWDTQTIRTKLSKRCQAILTQMIVGGVVIKND